MKTVVNSMHLKRIPVSADAQAVVGGALQSVLSDLVAMTNYTKQAHWSVVGRRFSPVHELLDAIFATLSNQTDEAAERLGALNIAPDGRITTVARTTQVEEYPEGAVVDTDAVSHVADRLAGVIERMRAHEAEVRDFDPVSDDMLIGFLGELEKHLWMLQAQEA